ncbi:hypothetical protein RZS08_31035, partial [Arthrospira platensis SPKY1]|nr:hypothetical protein [Arthrospira platensis SPKY1]
GDGIYDEIPIRERQAQTPILRTRARSSSEPRLLNNGAPSPTPRRAAESQRPDQRDRDSLRRSDNLAATSIETTLTELPPQRFPLTFRNDRFRL